MFKSRKKEIVVRKLRKKEIVPRKKIVARKLRKKEIDPRKKSKIPRKKEIVPRKKSDVPRQAQCNHPGCNKKKRCVVRNNICTECGQKFDKCVCSQLLAFQNCVDQIRFGSCSE